MCIFYLTHGQTRSWRNGDAQCCQLSNIADTFSDFFPFTKVPKPNSVSDKRRYCRASDRSCFPSTRTRISLSLSPRLLSFCSARTHIFLSLHLLSLCSARGRKEQSLIKLNTDIMLLASLILHASIAKITAHLLSLSYGYFI